LLKKGECLDKNVYFSRTVSHIFNNFYLNFALFVGQNDVKITSLAPTVLEKDIFNYDVILTDKVPNLGYSM